MNRELINKEYDIYVKIESLLRISTLIKARSVAENLTKKQKFIFEIEARSVAENLIKKREFIFVNRELVDKKYDAYVKIEFLLKTSTLIKARFVVKSLTKKRKSIFKIETHFVTKSLIRKRKSVFEDIMK